MPDESLAAGRRGADLLARCADDPQIGYLDLAIAEFRQSEAFAVTDVGQAEALHWRGRAHRMRYTYFGDAKALDDSVAALSHARRLTSKLDPEWVRISTNLANAHADRFEVWQAPNDLAAADAAYRDALDEMPADHPDRPGALALLVSLLRRRFDLTSDLRYLTEAMELCREATEAPCQDRRLQSMIHHQCSLTWLTLFDATNDPAAIREAEAHARAGLAAGPTEVACRAGLLCALGTALRVAAVQANDVDALRRARQELVEAVAITPGGSALHVGYAVELANVLSEIYLRTGEQSALNQAIGVIRTAAEAAPLEPAVGTLLFTLGNLLLDRYHSTRVPADLDQATTAYREAVERMSEGDSFRPMAIAALAGLLGDRLQHTKDRQTRQALIADAVALMREAASQVRDGGGRERTTVLNNAAAVLHLAFRQTGETNYLDEASDYLGMVVRDPKAGAHPTYRHILNNLALVLDDDPRPDRVDPAAAERLMQEALALVGPGHVDHFQAVTNLAAIWTARFRVTGSRAALDEALRLRKSLEDHPAPVRDRIRNTVCIAELYAEDGGWQAALDAYQRAIDLLPAAARLALGPDGRAFGLTDFFAVASDAAACALVCGQPTVALELLERGRGILLGQAREAWQVVDFVRHHAARDEAQRVVQLRAQLNRNIDSGPQSSSGVAWLVGPDAIANRVAAEAELAQLLARIGYESAARPNAVTLVNRLDGHQIAIINISRYRCDALLIAAGRITVLPLGLIDRDTVSRQISELFVAVARRTDRDLYPTGAAQNTAESSVPDVLAWLWHDVVEPVLHGLGITSAPQDGRWPRIWWCPTGPAVFLPFHAAGTPESGSPRPHDPQRPARSAEATIDRVISSYTLTLADLVDGLASEAVSRSPQRRVFAAGIATGEDGSPLPGVDAEMTILSSRIPAIRVLRDAEATRDNILAGLGDADWFHFAGHGHQHVIHSRDAMLIPYDSRTSGPISPVDVIAANPRPRDLAYLSACDSARGHFALADEGAHIAGAFMAAGFRHVVATGWYLRDEAAVDVTELFYEFLDRNPNDKASALHLAVRESRRRTEPLVWGTFMHFGP